MLIDEAEKLYKNLRLHNYRSLFRKIREKDGRLSATEAFSVDAINILGEPTIKQFSDFLGISQPNASYKVASLIEKGYIEKESSEDDRREFRLRVSQRFRDYYGDSTTVFRNALSALENGYSPEELALFENMLTEINSML